jgi:hypothetical protein
MRPREALLGRARRVDTAVDVDEEEPSCAGQTRIRPCQVSRRRPAY